MNACARRAVPVMLLLLFAAVLAHGDAYQMRYLDMPEGSTGEPRAINDLGQVVGEIWGLPVPTVALWDSAGRLSMPISGTAWAYDISNHGQVVGLFQASPGYHHPFVWSADTGMTDLSTSLPLSAEVLCINANGQMAGTIGFVSPYQSFVWDTTSGITYLPMIGYENSYPMGISDSGVVAGTVNLPDHTGRAFVWTAQGGMTILFPDDPWNAALAISTGGLLLGASSLGGGAAELFIWSAEYGKVTIGISTDQHPLWPMAVNDRGQVAGTMASPGEGQQNAFVWDPETGITILGEGRACDINNSGWVAGTVGNSQTGQAVLWEPVPEPSSLLALGMGVLPLVRMFTRRRVRSWIQGNG